MERICFLKMIRVLLFHFLIISLFIAAAAAAANTIDRDALLSLKAHITYDPSNILANNWNTSSSVCNWMGITCDVRSRRVTGLNISLFGLVGTIPSQLGNLSSLQTLDLSFNRFSGTIPSSIFNISSLLVIDFKSNTFFDEIRPNICDHIPNLEVLFLRDNMFHGKIPSTLSNCRQLQNLSLSFNNFVGTIPKEIGNLTKLQELFLHDNKLQGKIPHELGNLAELKILKLYHNNLIGEIPHEIGNLHNLQFLVLDGNKLDGVVPTSIFNISTLKSLELDNNSLSGSLRSSADVRLPNLKELFLWGNNFSGPIPNFIFNASMLSRVELQENAFSGFIPTTFDNLRNLRYLELRDNFLTSSTRELSFLSSLSNCKNLEILDLSFNLLNGILPKAVGNLSKSLKEIYMFGCNISGNIPEEISILTNLTIVCIGGNKLNGSIPITLGRLGNLQLLNFQENKLEGSISNDLCHLTELYEMDLSDNMLAGSIPTCFGNLTSLRHLYLGSNGLTSTIPSTFWNLNFILLVNLSSNFLTGSLPLEFVNLKVLIGIDLSRNNLSGAIPTTIGGLKDLQSLYLEYNRFQGLIPNSFGDMISLESLNLSNNNLSGAIPLSLEKLLFLKDLNLSFNKLEGEVPKGGPFANFSSTSFFGNDLLCGPSHLQVPPCKIVHHQALRKKFLLLGILLPLCIIFMMLPIVFIFRTHEKRKEKKRKEMARDHNMSPQEIWRRFSYLELFRATNEFSESNLIGRGSFGFVYKGSTRDGILLAIKVFHPQIERALKSFDVECEVMKNIRHRNLVKIISNCSSDDFKALVLEYMPNGSLEKCLYSINYILDIFQRLNIMIDVASGLEYLHYGYSTPVIHCDLKPSNVLLDDNMVAHLSDFGISKLLTREDQSMTQTQTLATIGYMAPEYGREGKVSTKGDIYSFGIMLLETFTKKKPTSEDFVGDLTLKQWVSDLLPISVMEVVDVNMLSKEDKKFVAKEQCVTSILNLAMECAVELPEQRINAKETVRKLSKIRDLLRRDVEGKLTK